MGTFEKQTFQDIRENLLTTLHDLSINPKPTYKIGEKSVDWNEYQEKLIKQIEWLNNIIKEIDETLETIYFETTTL